MDSMPLQPIHSLPSKTQRDSYTKVGHIALLLAQGETSIERIVTEVGFGSEEAMRIQLQTWGLSGMLPLPKQTTKGKAKDLPSKKSGERKAGALSDDAEQLVPIEDATHLFELAITTLQSDLYKIQEHREELRGVKGRKGKLFITTSSPAADAEPRPSMQAAGPAPDPAIVRLIAAYLLCTNLSVECLLDTLHHKPSEADREKIHKLIAGKDGLLQVAEDLAINIRGGRTGHGRNLAPPSSYEHAWLSGLREGISPEELEQRMLGAGVEESDVARFKEVFGEDA